MNLLSNINWTRFGYVIIILAVLAVIFTILILVVNKLCKVEEDPKISQIKENLAGANCGGCGYKGCADFAKALVEGKAEINNCSPTDNHGKLKIAEILGVEIQSAKPMMAIVKCAGNKDVTKNKFDYVGNPSCDAKNALLGGDKKCNFGCLGGGDCTLVCQENGVEVTNGVAVIDKNSCMACGLCIKACPKQIIEFIPKDAKVYVACSSKCKGKEVLDACSIGCIGCGLCAKNCPEGAIEMINNLPVINYDKCSGCLTCIDKCPRKTIKKL